MIILPAENTMIKRILILTVLTCGGCWAQTDASRPASTNPTFADAHFFAG